MPEPQFTASRLLPPATPEGAGPSQPAPLGLPEPLWEPYTASVEYAGLYLAITAPCGCVVHYDTSAASIENHKGILTPCGAESCDFAWDACQDTAKTALADYTTAQEEMRE